ncbi:MAG: hypothetical protein A2341_15825 [Deltaproteobacteria bacterium RIFOXYB12_FULL_58_9]|nr:MAG: hypothetical protein A2341_15825 [Deltaproteobacteria bacterium RIFOXYB12_FULL_58_9]
MRVDEAGSSNDDSVQDLDSAQDLDKVQDLQDSNIELQQDQQDNPNVVSAAERASQQQDQGEGWGSFAANETHKIAPCVQDSFGHGAKNPNKDEEQISAAALLAQLQIQKGMLKG